MQLKLNGAIPAKNIGIIDGKPRDMGTNSNVSKNVTCTVQVPLEEFVKLKTELGELNSRLAKFEGRSEEIN